VAAQAAVQPGSGHVGIEKFPGHGQEIIQGQEQGLAEVDHDGFLGGRERGFEGVGPVRGVFDRGAVFPLADGRPADAMFWAKARSLNVDA
jgi:hypothetical protein